MLSGIEKISLLLDKHEKDLSWHNGTIENWVEAWYELVYCILAGSKVHTKIVLKSYANLIEKEPKNVLFSNLIVEQEKCMRYLKETLRQSGYRFYNSKAETVLNAAFFYISVYSDLENKKVDAKELRTKIVSNVSGIGIKIATHWLRNIGFDFPIVDVHTRNILVKVQLIDRKFKKQSLTISEYLFIENVLFNLSKQLSMPASNIDYALWKHGMERCQCTVL